MKGIAVIPARGGSKGVPRKNIRPLGGRPLLDYSVSVAKDCPYIDRVIVSTDDAEIEDVALACGAEVPFLRPSSLAQDHTPTFDVLLHLYQWLLENGDYQPDLILLLQPTSPFRNVDDVNEAVELYIRNQSKCDQVVSVVEAKHHPNWCFRAHGDTLVRYEKKTISRRQDLPPVYALNGAVYVYSPRIFDEHRSPQVTKFVVMPKERSLDIDTEFDFQLAEMMMNERLSGVV